MPVLSPNTQTHEDIMKTMCTWHQVTDGNGIPLAGRLSSGAEHKLRHALPVVDRICVSKQGQVVPRAVLTAFGLTRAMTVDGFAGIFGIVASSPGIHPASGRSESGVPVDNRETSTSPGPTSAGNLNVLLLAG